MKDYAGYEDFKGKYKERLAKELGDKPNAKKRITTRDYENFKKSFMPKQLSFYEKACNFSEKIIPISPDKKSLPEIQEAIRISHLNISPGSTYSFAIISSLVIALGFFVLGYLVPFMVTSGGSSGNFFFIYFGILMALISIIPLTKLPFIISNYWRMKASNQMVLSIFYIVTFMRHTSNIELAIDFAAEHLAPPLNLDFKKVIWDIETRKYDSITDSLGNYLELWRKWNPEFIESMNLIQSSLYENSDVRRLDALDKGLKVILDETYEKMLHYTHNLKGPITTLHMLGIILPILGLVILPLIIAFVPEAQWYHLFAFYNILLPVLVYYMGRQILSTRPTGYSGVDSSNLDKVIEDNKVSIKFQGSDKTINLGPALIGFIAGIFFLLIGLTPLLYYHYGSGVDYALTDIGIIRAEDIDGEQVYGKFLDYRPLYDAGTPTGREHGPYGLGSSLLSLGIPLSVGLGFGLYNLIKSKGLMKIRTRTAELEKEFASALFQLGNRLGDGIPAEIAFSSVSEVMRGTASGKFFELASNNIVKLGMNSESAIFDKDVGALQYYPSSIIESSMKVFVESSRKGPLVASQALITVAEYIKSMHRVDERLKDLMADVISNMKSQINFLTPVISGIVVGITSMISQILGSLSERMDDFETQGGIPGGGIMEDLFQSGGVPTYFFQAIVGLYVVQISYIMTIIVNGIQNGTDKMAEYDLLGNNMVNAALIYSALAGIGTIIFSVIASTIVSGL